MSAIDHCGKRKMAYKARNVYTLELCTMVYKTKMKSKAELKNSFLSKYSFNHQQIKDMVYVTSLNRKYLFNWGPAFLSEIVLNFTTFTAQGNI